MENSNSMINCKNEKIIISANAMINFAVLLNGVPVFQFLKIIEIFPKSKLESGLVAAASL